MYVQLVIAMTTRTNGSSQQCRARSLVRHTCDEPCSKVRHSNVNCIDIAKGVARNFSRGVPKQKVFLRIAMKFFQKCKND